MSKNLPDPRLVTVRVEDCYESEGYFQYQALLLGKDPATYLTAAHISNEELELHYLQPSADSDRFHFYASAYPGIYVGADEEQVYQDLHQLTAAEFFGKYPCYSQDGGDAKHWHAVALERHKGIS
jgi:hypothetical protein